MTKTEFMQTMTRAADPYQAYFDYLVGQGKSTGEAWDILWN